MAKTMQTTVSKVDQPLFAGAAVSVTVPSVEGELTILPEHVALIVPLKAGTLTVRTEAGEETVPVDGGVCEVSRNQVTVLL